MATDDNPEQDVKLTVYKNETLPFLKIAREACRELKRQTGENKYGEAAVEMKNLHRAIANEVDWDADEI